MDKYIVMECKLRDIKIKLAKLKACAALLITRQQAQKQNNEKELAE
jgi:hypothetical protein